MSVYEFMGIMYIAQASVAGLGIGIILMMKKGKIITLNKTNGGVLATMILSMALGLLYFIIDYYSVIMVGFENSAAVMVADIWISVGKKAAWSVVVLSIFFVERPGLRKVIMTGMIISFAAAFINYGLILDDDYYVEEESLRPLAVTLQVAMAAFLTAVDIYFIQALLRRKSEDNRDGELKKFAVLTTVLLSVDGIMNTENAIKLMVGKIYLKDYGIGSIDITAALQLAFAICLLWYIIKYCFLAQYKTAATPAAAGEENLTEDQRLDIIAEDAELTDREKEVMKLIFNGATYQDIASWLYISKNTVKHHVSSIYKKTGVSSKMELVTLAREMKRE